MKFSSFDFACRFSLPNSPLNSLNLVAINGALSKETTNDFPKSAERILRTSKNQFYCSPMVSEALRIFFGQNICQWRKWFLPHFSADFF